MATETEIKLRCDCSAEEARKRIEQAGYCIAESRTLESDQLFDRANNELRQSAQLLRLRRAGSSVTVTYKGRPAQSSYKSREEIEFDVSDPEAFEQVLDRLGYIPGFRYEKYRTKFRAESEPGIVTLDETPIGVFLELEGPPDWIDQTAERLGFSPADYSTASYASLYREYVRSRVDAPANMTFDAFGRLKAREK